LLLATEQWQIAIQKYPTNAEILADLALGLNEAGDHVEAVRMAEKALKQDEISRSWGHVDRYLPDSISSQLRQLDQPSGNGNLN
jgi:hypothetical protein